MDRTRFSRGSAKTSMTAHHKKAPAPAPAADLTDFMNDMFFGTVNNDAKKSYNLTGNRWDDNKDNDDDEGGFDDSIRSDSSKLTQEWLHEARRMVASSPSRCDSPASARLLGSPRFASPRLSTGSILDKRDPLSRSARRNRATEGFSEEILTRSARHSRNGSIGSDSVVDSSPASQVHKWISNNLKPPTSNGSSPEYQSPNNNNNGALIFPANDAGSPLPPRQSTIRKSRFRSAPKPSQPPLPPASSPQDIPRRFKQAPVPEPTGQMLSPPKNLVESAHRRSISKSTCSIEKIAPNSSGREDDQLSGEQQELSLNGFLKKQRAKIEQIMNKEVEGKAKIILSGPSNSTSSMVAAICHAWLMENRARKSKEDGGGDGETPFVVVPVMNVRRGRMWKQRQAAWLFHHVGLDAKSLLFAEEVDFENLMMSGQLNILVVGQDILRTNGEVGSQCTILTDNYCEDAYDLLEFPMLKKLLLAGILLDTQNLNSAVELSTTRDSEAVQLLLAGSAPNYRTNIYDQLIQDQKDQALFEAFRHSYGKPPSSESGRTEKSSSNSSQNESNTKTKGDTTRTAKQAPKPAPAQQQPNDSSRGKNKSFLSKWFGFGGK
ncbi:unnamed protein product [Linum trigynum]|uniref:Exopolyphosphatase n=1 Tax=Linum trigynum TaxID=586398 RepID=A0AAV2EY09_9ROSI